MGTDGVRVAGAATMNYLQATMLTRGHCFLWYAIGDDLRNRRNPDFALTSTLPTCEPEVDRADSTMHRICRPAPAPGGCGGRDRAATCHPLDRCTFKEMSDDKYPPRTGCF